MLKIILSLSFLTLSFFPSIVLAQHDFDSLYDASVEFRKSFEAIQDTFDLFGNESVLEIAIISDFKQMNRQKDTLHYQDALLEYVLNDTIIVHREIGIKARGNYRRETCSYPPLKLNFPQKSARLEWLQTFDKMKMVGNCKAGVTYEQYLLSEYYVYKMFNILTDQSFRVRLLHVTYQDSGRKDKKSRQLRYAFIIEPQEAVAERLNSYLLNTMNLSYGVFQPENVDLIAVFQYMIGNTDWSIPAQHNMKILKSKNPNIFTPVAVPYDFDYCGFVNPPYAIPSEILPIENITERLYRGPCREDVGEYDPILDKFMQKKNDLYALIENSEYLNKNSKKHMISYLDSFYQIITNPKRVNAALSANCE